MKSPALRFVQDERGSVTAEFALTIPVVLLVLGLVVGSVHLSAERVALVALAGEIARLEARGDSSLAAERIAKHPGVRIERSNDGRVLCVSATAGTGPGLLAAVTVSGRGCAAVSSATAEAGW